MTGDRTPDEIVPQDSEPATPAPDEAAETVAATEPEVEAGAEADASPEAAGSSPDEAGSETAVPETSESDSPAPQASAPQASAPERAATGEAGDGEAGDGEAPVERVARRGKRNLSHGQAHIKASFNNTIISITDLGGNSIAWTSGGSVGFKGSRKSTPYAAQVAAEQAARKAGEVGIRKLDVVVRGSGSGRETAIRTLQTMGMEVTGVKDLTPTPHNGCREKKRRRN